MHIALASDAFARDARFGLSRYVHELRKGLVARGALAIPVSSVSQFGADEPPWLAETGFVHVPLSRRVLATAWALGSPLPRIERWLPPVDLVHSADLDYPVATRKPWVVTFHDLGPLTRPHFFGKARPWLLKALIAAAVSRAAAVICVSQATADEFDALSGGKAAGRVKVIEEGVGQEFFEPPPGATMDELPAMLGDGPFFLFTGSINPRKNLSRVLSAFAAVAPHLPHRLVLTGAAGWEADSELSFVATSALSERIVNLGYVSDEMLRALYARADGFLYPSLYEGFGLPILEAMAAGCPVITSRAKPMSELGEGAALLVDPLAVDDIAAAMTNLARDGDLRARCRRDGMEQARRFSWEACVDATIGLYRAVLGDRQHG